MVPKLNASPISQKPTWVPNTVILVPLQANMIKYSLCKH